MDINLQKFKLATYLGVDDKELKTYSFQDIVEEIAVRFFFSLIAVIGLSIMSQNALGFVLGVYLSILHVLIISLIVWSYLKIKKMYVTISLVVAFIWNIFITILAASISIDIGSPASSSIFIAGLFGVFKLCVKYIKYIKKINCAKTVVFIENKASLKDFYVIFKEIPYTVLDRVKQIALSTSQEMININILLDDTAYDNSNILTIFRQRKVDIDIITKKITLINIKNSKGSMTIIE